MRPPVTPELIEAVERSYGVSLGAATDLGGSANLNLLARGERGALVVRAYRHHVTEARLEAIQGARAALAAAGLPCAVAVPAAGGSGYICVGDHLIEVEPFVPSDATMGLAEMPAGLPVLARVHDALAATDLCPAASQAPFANAVDPVGLVAATSAGTKRIRSWKPTADETAIADAADRLAEAAARESVGDLPRQLVHGDYWDNNVLFRGGAVVLVGDFDFLARRTRVDELALTLFFTTYLLDDALGAEAWRVLAALVGRYDAGADYPLTTAERAALPIALARQPLWSIAVWAAQLDDVATARAHIRGHLAAVELGIAILADLGRYQEVFGDARPR